MNTFERGQVRTLVYRSQEDGVWYGTALEFNLTIDGDDKNIVLLELDRAIKDYLRSAREIGAVELLNQVPDPELDTLWKAHIENKEVDIESPYTAHLAATEALYA